jgi:glycosyltransferase involved in cell wall biosynthesis
MSINIIPCVSVIMLAYNRENLVNRAIESVLARTWSGFEFIIVDTRGKLR